MTASVFLDTSAIVAVANKRDTHHARAADALHELVASRRRLLTTNYMLSEAYTLARRRLGHAHAVAIADALLHGKEVVLVRVSEDQEREALELLRKQVDKDYSFADASAFVVMKASGATEAFTFDGHFAQAGFTQIPAPKQR